MGQARQLSLSVASCYNASCVQLDGLRCLAPHCARGAVSDSPSQQGKLRLGTTSILRHSAQALQTACRHVLGFPEIWTRISEIVPLARGPGNTRAMAALWVVAAASWPAIGPVRHCSGLSGRNAARSDSKHTVVRPGVPPPVLGFATASPSRR